MRATTPSGPELPFPVDTAVELPAADRPGVAAALAEMAAGDGDVYLDDESFDRALDEAARPPR